MTVMPEEETGRFSCPVCPLRFRTLREKKQHIRDNHSR